MKKLLTLLMLLSGSAWAQWHASPSFLGFSLPDYSNGLHASPIGGRGFINGQWLAGYGVDVLYWQIPGSFNGNPLPRLYVAMNHEWNAAEVFNDASRAAGVWGPAVGLSVGGLATKLEQGVSSAVNLVHDTGGPVLSLPPWLVNDLDKWLTIEAGGGYRIFGHMNDVKPWEAWVGGKLTVPFDLLTPH